MTSPSTRELHGTRTVARKLALQALYRWQLNDCPWQDLVNEFADAEDMPRADGDYFAGGVRTRNRVMVHAVAIFASHDGVVAGAVSVTGIKGDLPAWRVNELGQAVRRAADGVSEMLGGPRYADREAAAGSEYA